METTGGLTYLGKLEIDADGSLPDDPMAQLELAFKNIKANLEAADMDVCDLTKLTFYMVGEFETEKRRSSISNFLNDVEVCMTMVYVPGLASKDIKIEIDAWACKESK